MSMAPQAHEAGVGVAPLAVHECCGFLNMLAESQRPRFVNGDATT